jgi:hypothetical protein
MTWARVIATGSGRLDFRLEIAGCQHEWTTHSRITHASGADGRTVYPGLQYQGLELNERAILKECWVDVSGITAKIRPTTPAEETIAAFTRTPEPVAYLGEGGGVPGLDADSSTIHLDNAVTLAPGYYHLGSECILVGTANSIDRAKWGTTAQRHYIRYGATAALSVPIYRYPPTLEGRRATLYVYGDGDDPTGEGTAIWRGIVARPPRLASDGIGWDIAIDPVTKSLDQQVAAAEGLQYRIRGIYHSGNFPMRIWIVQRPNTNQKPKIETFVTGFFDTVEEFTTAVNVKLTELITARTAQIGGDGSEISEATYYESGTMPGGLFYSDMSGAVVPVIRMKTAPYVSAAYSDTSFDFGSLAFTVESYLEGFCSAAVGSTQYSANNTAGLLGDSYSFFSHNTGYQQNIDQRFGDSEGKPATPLGDNSPNKPITAYPLATSRAALGTIGNPNVIDATWPSDRLYLNSVDDIVTNDVLLVKNGDKVIPILVTGVDDSDRFVTAVIQSGDPVVWFDSYTEIIPARIFAMNTDLHGFVSQLQEKAPNANDGDTPYVPEGDLDLDAFERPFTLSDTSDYWRYRNYIWLKPTSIKEIVREELKAIGWMLRLEANGQVGCTPLPLATSGSSAQTLDETRGDILLPAKSQVGSWPRWEAQADGLVNTIQVSLGYRIGDDDFDPKFDFTVRNITSIAEHKSSGLKGSVTIAPKSTSAFALTLPGISPDPSVSAILSQLLTPASVSQWVAGYLRVLSQDYATVTVAVPFRFFNLLIGDYVNVTCSLLPNGLGGRGVTSAKAVVVGRKWTFDPGANSMGTLTLYFPREVASGYAPSAHVTGRSNIAGNTWDLSCDPSDALNVLMSEGADGNVAKHFAANDRVQIVKRDDGLNPTTVPGTVISSTGNVVRVAFTSTWVPGTGDWILQYQIDAGNATTHQLLFSYVADAIRTLTNGSYARRYL